MTTARKQACLALIGCELIWGASQPLVKPALEYINSAQFLFLRYLVAAPLVVPLIVRGFKELRLSLKEWLRVLVVEIMGIGNLFLLYSGLEYVTSLQSSLILQTRPIFVTLASVMFLAEKEEGHEWMGLVLSVLGTFTILLKPFLMHQSGLDGLSFVGVSLLVLSNLIYTVNTLLVKRYYLKLPKAMISGVHMWIGLIMFLVYLWPTQQMPALSLLLNPSVLVAVLYMSIFGSIIALTLSNFGYSKIEASEATLFIYLQPLVYMPLSVIWLKESLSLMQIIGMILIFTGVWWAERRPKKTRVLKHGVPLLTRFRLAELVTPVYKNRSDFK